MLNELTWFTFRGITSLSVQCRLLRYVHVPLLLLGLQQQTGQRHSGIQRLSVELGQHECTHWGPPYSTACTKTDRATTAAAAAETTDPRASTVSIDPSSNWNLFHALLLLLISFWLEAQHHWTPQTPRPRFSRTINLSAALCSNIWGCNAVITK